MKLYYSKLINWLSFVAAIALFFFNGSLFAETDSYRINWNQSQLSISADNAPLTKILTEIMAQTGLEIRGLPSIQDTVSLDFSNLSLREGLQKVLVKNNYLIIDKKSSDGTIIPGTVIILNSQTGSLMPMATDEQQAEADGDIPEVSARLSRLEQLIGANAPDLKESLYAATKDNEPMIRELAYRELYQRGDVNVLDILRRDARGEDIDVRRTALEVLSQLDQENAIEILSEAASDSNIDIRQTALENLSQTERGLTIIKEKLRNPDPDVRIAAIETLASLGEGPAREAAEEILHDADERVRAKAEAIHQELQGMPAVTE